MAVNAEANFRAKAPGIMAQLIRDFPLLGIEDAAAILGNAGHESKGLTDDQEDKPTVPGSRGGLNWMQWTGPRRRAMEAYCARNNLDPNSDEAAYKWLFIELKGIEGTEKSAIPKTIAAKGLDAKVEAFEKAFLRAGVKHYPSRKLWAKRALDAYNTPLPIDLPDEHETPATEPRKGGISPWLVLGALVVIAIIAIALFTPIF